MWQVCRGLTRPSKSVNALRSRRKTRRLVLDWLEPRTLLSNVSWTGTADGKSWAVAGNWSNNKVPTPGDDVTINIAGNPTIQITTGNQSVHSLTASEPISIIAGSLTVARRFDSERRPHDDRRCAGRERREFHSHRHGNDDHLRWQRVR